MPVMGIGVSKNEATANNMEQLLLFLLATSGLTIILTRSKIFKPVREYISMKKWTILESIFGCPLCMGVYVSAIVYIIQFQKIDILIISNIFAGSIVSQVISSLVQFLDRK